MHKIEEAYNRGYRVTSSGKLINPKGAVIGSVQASGYSGSFIRINKKCKFIANHRIQAFQKYGADLFKEGMVVRHLNGNPLDNSWDNIAIGTQYQNIMDIPEHIRMRSALHAASFVRKHNRKEIKAYYAEAKSYAKTMAKFNISSKGTLHYILNKGVQEL